MKQPDKALNQLEKVRSFVEQTSADIELDPNLERAACKARWLAKFLEVNYCGIYRLDRIEEALVQKLEHPTSPPGKAKAGYLFMVSEVYAYGGHTQLIKNLFKVCEEPKRICITRAQPSQAALHILNADPHQVEFVMGQSETQKIQHLAQQMAGYEKVLLVIHPDDINCATAARLAKLANPGLRIGFINHSDHTFSVGIGLADVVFEISSFGWALRDKRGILEKASFMGLPISPVPKHHVPKEAMALTGGSWYKYKPSRGQSIMPYLRALLHKRPEITLHVIGPNLWLNPWWWRLKLAYPRRLRIAPLQPKDKYTELLQQAQIYIDSYPVTGGMAFSESVGYGCLPVGVQMPVMGYSVLDTYRVNNVDDFLNYTREKTKTENTFEEWIEQLQKVVETTHQPEACFERVQFGMDEGNFVPLPSNSIVVKEVEFFNETWLTNGHSIMPTILDINFNIQLQLIKTFSKRMRYHFMYRKWLLIRSRLVRGWFLWLLK